jgi:transposase
MVIVGVDAHTRNHAAAVVDDRGRVLGQMSVGAAPPELERLIGWVRSLDSERLVAVEGARGLGLALVRRLIAAGETVVDVPAVLTAEGRRRSTRPGKDDETDAVTIARVAIREPHLPRINDGVLNADLKLLVDARDQLVAEAARVRNRLHALLLVLAPGYRDLTGALISKRALATARRLATRARNNDRVRAKLACAAVARLRCLDGEINELEAEIGTLLRTLAPTNLMAICGVGTLVAAKILGETREVGRFRSKEAFAAYTGTAPIPASSGTVVRHRLNRGGNRQLNRALFTVAMTQARWDPQGRAYLARKRAEGKTPEEARRALKRHLATAVYRAMKRDAEALKSARVKGAA